MPNQKPPTCQGCPLYGDGLGWVPDVLRPVSTLVITMFPTTYEATRGVPRVGVTVDKYVADYERYAGSEPLSYANVVRCRAQRGTKLPTGVKLREGALFCRQYDIIPPETKVLVFQGEDVVKHLAPDVPKPLTWRGFLLQKGDINHERPNDF